MTKFNTMMLAAAAAPAMFAANAQAQVAGIAIANPEAAVANSAAWTAARTQIQTTYKAQIDQANARRTAIENELRPLVTAFQTAQNAATPNEASLRTQAQAIQTKQQAGEQELGRLLQPVNRAQAYALEQLQRQLSAAVQAATQRKNVSLLLTPNAALFAQPTADITADITTELNRLVPSVTITPPANWQPGQQQAGAAAPAAAGAATRPATTTPARPNQTQGR
jgi:Skp family chaperone for outer membrane proteins